MHAEIGVFCAWAQPVMVIVVGRFLESYESTETVEDMLISMGGCKANFAYLSL